MGEMEERSGERRKWMWNIVEVETKRWGRLLKGVREGEQGEGKTR